MSTFLNIIFFLQSFFLIILIISRNPARLPGFEKSRNKDFDKVITFLLVFFVFIMFAFKCR